MVLGCATSKFYLELVVHYENDTLLWCTGEVLHLHLVDNAWHICQLHSWSARLNSRIHCRTALWWRLFTWQKTFFSLWLHVPMHDTTSGETIIILQYSVVKWYFKSPYVHSLKTDFNIKTQTCQLWLFDIHAYLTKFNGFSFTALVYYHI